ncbi:hypothetical protein K1T71_006470 [Dendrolimus kikuchii]|uniref:Uncharacterized protein n=1 Tax=Dendrolimus kikuchii TaxID=765133 RepID=A0ACC1D224_9NEOP|nr:hypothetical protein K1T71_006470 [Dendrolimus kikuchii]
MASPNEFNPHKVPIEVAIDKTGFGLYSYTLIALTGAMILSSAFITYGSTILVPASACELQTNSGQQGALAAAPVVGAIIGVLLWGYLADTRGRWSMLLVSLIVGAIINMVASISVNWIMLMSFQFLASLMASGLYSMSMSLMSECVPMAKRNLVVLLVSSIFLLSQGIMAVIAIPIIPLTFNIELPALGIYWNSWRTLLLVNSVPNIISAIWLYFMQDSPKFAFAKGDEEKALEILRTIHRINHLGSKEEYPVKGLLPDPKDVKEGSTSAKDQILPLFKAPLLKYTLIMTALFVFQQIGAFLVWLPTVANQFIRIIETGEGSDMTLCGVIEVSVNTPIAEDEVPCALNVTAMLMVLAIGALQSVINLLLSTILNLMLVNNCDAGFYLFSSIFASSAIIASLLPDDRRLVAAKPSPPPPEKDEPILTEL